MMKRFWEWYALTVPEIAVSDLSEARLMLAEQAGADRTGSNLEGEYDIVFDAVGNAATRRMALEGLRPGGTSVWIGLHSAEAGFDAQDLIRGETRVLGTFASHHQDFQAAIGLARDFRTQWLTTRPLEEGVETFTALLGAPAPTVKTLLVPEEP
jgi:threonine dehydrogenase-like Zn-dependent dehydrogenase